MLDEFTAYDEGDVLKTPGIQWGVSTKQYIQVVVRQGTYLILKVPGQTGWAGRGNKAYHPTEYSLVKLLESPEETKVLVREVQTITPGRDRKQLRDLQDLCLTLSKKGSSRARTQKDGLEKGAR